MQRHSCLFVYRRAIMNNPLDALKALKTGNAQFVSTVEQAKPLTTAIEASAMHEAQKPFAIVLSCSDSRAPAELLFNQGFGALFVVRVAGNIVTPAQLASIEFAVMSFGVPLVVVMGHSNCGAIAASIDALEHPEKPVPDGLQPIVVPICSIVAPLLDSPLKGDRVALMNQAIRDNVSSAAGQLRAASGVIKERVASQDLLVVGAEYNLQSGVVDFFDGLPM